MGLDMYIEAEVYLSTYNEKEKALKDTVQEYSIYGLDKFEPKKVVYEVGYWRKANAIHNWFVENVQSNTDDCERYYVPLEQLSELKELCEKTLNNLNTAPENLPTKQGFFFGSYEYDERYNHDLNHTIYIINKINDIPDAKYWVFYYQSSW